MNTFIDTVLNDITTLLEKYRNDHFFERNVKELIFQKNAPRAIKRTKLYYQLEWLLKEIGLEEIEESCGS